MATRQAGSKPPLNDELRILRRVLNQVVKQADSGELDFAKGAALAARVSDAIVRLRTAQQKLATGEDRLGRLRAEVDEVLRSLGLGEHAQAILVEEGEEGDDEREG